MANSDSGVSELILQREQLRGWIERLDTVGGEASDRVTQRVRADYDARLQRVIEQLGSHVEELQRDLEAVRASLGDAAGRRDEAADALEEMRLRHVIGELDEAGWEDARPGLEGALEKGEEEVRQAESEAERLAHLLSEIQGPAEAPEPEPEPAPEPEPEPVAEAEPEPEPLPTFDEPPAPEPVAEAPAAEPEPASAEPEAPAEPVGDPFGDEFGGAPAAPAPASADADEDLPWLEALEEKTREWETGDSDGLDFLKDAAPAKPAGGGTQQLGEDDLAFLEELDRAIGGGPGGAAPPPPPPPAPKASDAPTQPAGAAPAGRLICKECGAPNEPHAWYCEVCGSEL